MKPVENVIKFIFPKVGDKLQLRRSPTSPTRTLVNIEPCDHRPLCVQDDDCHYCLQLETYTGSRSHHCWNDNEGNPWWRIVE